jgi:catechol 2,3-dioxygenase-like lactoylglutathione lyase family enzyme
MLDHATVRTLDLEGTRAFLEAVLGPKLNEQKLKQKPRAEAGSEVCHWPKPFTVIEMLGN